eukprot:5443436-Heterocapsa_arctica.AAC.1
MSSVLHTVDGKGASSSSSSSGDATLYVHSGSRLTILLASQLQAMQESDMRPPTGALAVANFQELVGKPLPFRASLVGIIAEKPEEVE